MPVQSAPAFEVASVRPQRGNMGKFYYGIDGGGRIVITNTPLRSIIAYAYGIEMQFMRFLLLGGSDDILDGRFDIEGVPPTSAQTDQHVRDQQTLTMLRTLLAERFSLRIHRETRALPVYALTVARDSRLGPKLRRSEHDCVAVRVALRSDPAVTPPRDANGDPLCTTPYFSSPKAGAISLRDAGPLEYFVSQIQAFLDRRVVDHTQLTGNYEWIVTFSNDPRDLELPSIFIALQRDLGLRLEESTAPGDVYVIDSVAMPTPN
jgi:uncharacterized protein (TIGR03435 family)